jgi:hypothetical protein
MLLVAWQITTLPAGAVGMTTALVVTGAGMTASVMTSAATHN